MFQLMLYGAIEATCQILLFRNLLPMFQGNEIALGLLLSLWLLFTGVGIVWVPSRAMRASLAAKLLPALPLLCLAQILLSGPMQHWLGWSVGEVLGMGQLVGFSTAILLPFCLVSGLVFRSAVKAETGSDKQGLGEPYFWEALGMGIGGLCFYAALPFLNHGSSAIPVIVGLSLVPLIAQAGIGERVQRNAGILLLILVCAWAQWKIPVIVNASEVIRFRPRQLMSSSDTPYGRIHIARTEGQPTLYLDHAPIATFGHAFHAEELLAPALVNLPGKFARVLVASPQVAHMQELLATTNAVQELDVIHWSSEMDEALTQIAGPLPKTNIQIAKYFGDPLGMVLKSDKGYDAIVWDLPSPVNLQMNRYYSLECFHALKRKLAPEGILVFSAEASEDYVGKYMAAYLRSIWATLGEVFENRIVLPGGNWVFVARKGRTLLWENPDTLTTRLQELGVRCQFFNQGYLPFRLSQQKVQAAYALLDTLEGIPNLSFHPEAHQKLQRLWAKYHMSTLTNLFGETTRRRILFRALVSAMVLMAVFSMIRSSKPALAWAPYVSVFVLSFFAMSMQWILLVCFQIVLGNLYSFFALAMAIFMIALAFGAFVGNKAKPKQHWLPAFHGIAIVLTITIVRVIAKGTQFLDITSLSVLFGTAMFATGFLSGFAFPVLSRNASPQSRLWIYAVELAGGCVAAIWVSMIAVPFWGFVTTLVLLGVANVVAFAGVGWSGDK